jgi:predicted  nucleic acid-binding Zn-ribbon protein
MEANVDRIDLYLQQQIGARYENTQKENEMVTKVAALYSIAKSVQEGIEYVSPNNLAKWRKAYLGTLNALDKNTGKESKRKSKQLRKMIYELIESKIDNTIPMPHITPRCKDDIDLVDITENYLKFEMDRMLTEQENDRGERATYIDGTSWYKIGWDSLDSTYGRSGDLKVEVLLADQVVPEPGCKDYRQMNYIFQREEISLSRIFDLYNRLITPDTPGATSARVISYYYRNEKGVIGRFMYAESSRQVISWDEDWQIRKVRKCTACGMVNPISDHCKNCGGVKFKYDNATEEVLEEDLIRLRNPYEEGESQDPTNNVKTEVFLEAGTRIPFYRVRQLPFVPRLSVSSLETLYGISEVSILLDMQDSVNKILTKVEDKIMKSGAVVTKPEKMKFNDDDNTFKIMGVRTVEEASQIQTKQIQADVSQDIACAQLFYESARASSGVTESYQGKIDNTAISGKAKEISAAQSAGRLESLRIMKAAAFAGVYELMFKYLLAFSDETRKFVKILPNGNKEEMLWNKYMFLRKDKYGKLYYADDFAFSTDPAATLSNNRVQMWKETLQQFTMGTFGNPQDPRTLELYWNIMNTMQYPLAKLALAGISDNSQHLPPDLEQALMQSPEILQMATQLVNARGEQRGGARPNSGPEGNGHTHAANVNKTNIKNAAETQRTSDTNLAQMTGGNI